MRYVVDIGRSRFVIEVSGSADAPCLRLLDELGHETAQPARVRRLGGRWVIDLDGRSVDLALFGDGTERQAQSADLDLVLRVYERTPPRDVRSNVATTGPRWISAPMPGRVIDVAVRVGDAVQPGQVLVVIEAMKMQNEILATHGGRVSQVLVLENTRVERNTRLIELTP